MTGLADRFFPVTASPPIDAFDAANAPAIDVAHLARMTLGDRDLEHEVLSLFDRQAVLLLARMGEVGAPGVATLAHTLKGSAQGVGALHVAAAAAALECAAGKAADRAPAIAELAAAVAEARVAIAAMLSISA
jgi:hypothetical protein